MIRDKKVVDFSKSFDTINCNLVGIVWYFFNRFNFYTYIMTVYLIDKIEYFFVRLKIVNANIYKKCGFQYLY